MPSIARPGAIVAAGGAIVAAAVLVVMPGGGPEPDASLVEAAGLRVMTSDSEAPAAPGTVRVEPIGGEPGFGKVYDACDAAWMALRHAEADRTKEWTPLPERRALWDAVGRALAPLPDPGSEECLRSKFCRGEGCVVIEPIP